MSMGIGPKYFNRLYTGKTSNTFISIRWILFMLVYGLIEIFYKKVIKSYLH